MKWNDVRKTNKYILWSSFADLPETSVTNYKPTWTIEEEDHDGLYSFHKWFLMFYKDPTEVEFVKNCFEGDFRHWEAFKKAKYIRDLYVRYKKEAEQRLLADTMNKIITIAMDTDNKSCMSALKYLADRGSKILGDAPDKGGRPKKSDIEAAARDLAREDKELLKDWERING
jgi:hypothetical protein|nr:MAG TPA: hypothetical protein [Caudoviricetes sp.]